MEEKLKRRSFLKYILGIAAFGTASFLFYRPEQGVKIGKMIDSLGPSEAHGKCGAAYNCSGGGGQCGAAYDCSGGGGKCGAAYNCSGQ